jgi:hypothetical protein
MTHETMAAILGELPAARRDGDAIVLGPDQEATVFVASPGSMMPVEKVHRVELREEYVVLETLKREHFYVAYADVTGLKVDLPEAGKTTHGAGFR